MIDVIMQVWIFLFSGTGVYLLSRTDRWHRWGYALSLAAQPAWIASTLMAGQWGVFALSLYFTWAWYKGTAARFDILSKDAA